MIRGSAAKSTLYCAAAAVFLAAAPVSALENATVDRFLSLSSGFHAQLPRSPVAGLGPAAQRDRAVCILTRFESAFGSEGVNALMGLMSVLSKGAEFDDATIVAFNDRFGPRYDTIVTRCTQAANS